MTVLVLSALGVAVVALVGGAIFAVLRGLEAWRALRRLRRTVGAGMTELARGVDGIERRVTRAGDGATRVGQAGAGLQESLAVLSLLTSAAGDARGALAVLAFLRR